MLHCWIDELLNCTNFQRAPRHDKRFARSEWTAKPRFEYEQTWRGGESAVQQAINMGILRAFWGADGIEYVEKGSYKYGREGSVETVGGTSKASVFLPTCWIDGATHLTHPAFKNRQNIQHATHNIQHTTFIFVLVHVYDLSWVELCWCDLIWFDL